jgi:hypothetical protein
VLRRLLDGATLNGATRKGGYDLAATWKITGGAAGEMGEAQSQKRTMAESTQKRALG